VFARVFARAGAEVTLAVRDLDAGRRASEQIAASGNRAVWVRPLDLADPQSVQAFVSQWSGPLHILVNNAGVMAGAERRTPRGWELMFATNHLGHFGLTVGLRPALALAEGARVVAVSSSAHLFSPVRFDDIHFQAEAYNRWFAYGQSKTANVLFSVEASSRWADDGITANALMPGVVLPPGPRVTGDPIPEGPPPGDGPLPTPKSVEQGAATAVLLATSPLLAASADGTSKTVTSRVHTSPARVGA
jgi:NAD(P)-dependent dehydrogenase (short-subunit alcohol dehydrogenase family)